MEKHVELTENDFEDINSKTMHMIDFVQLNSLLSNTYAQGPNKLQQQAAILQRKRDVIKQSIDGFLSVFFIFPILSRFT